MEQFSSESECARTKRDTSMCSVEVLWQGRHENSFSQKGASLNVGKYKTSFYFHRRRNQSSITLWFSRLFSFSFLSFSLTLFLSLLFFSSSIILPKILPEMPSSFYFSTFHFFSTLTLTLHWRVNLHENQSKKKGPPKSFWSTAKNAFKIYGSFFEATAFYKNMRKSLSK